MQLFAAVTGKGWGVLLGLGLLLAGACSPSNRNSSGGAVVPDLLEGGSHFVGTYPQPALVSYRAVDGRQLAQWAFPGQVQLFFQDRVDVADAVALIEASGGKVLSQLPALGVYLAGVTPGMEAQFIARVRVHPDLKDALPNAVVSVRSDAVLISDGYFNSGKPVPLNVPAGGVVVIDSGFHPGGHGDLVAATIEDHGGTVAAKVNLRVNCVGYCAEQPATSADRLGLILAAAAQGNALFNPGQPLVANISFGPEVKFAAPPTPAQLAAAQAQNQTDNEQFLRAMLQQTGAIPKDLLRNLAVTFALGNSHVDLTQALANLRMDPLLGDVLAKCFTLAATAQVDPATGLAFSNYVGGPDPDVVVLGNAESAWGTSFASPAVAAMLQRLMALYGITLQQAQEAVKSAVDADADGVVEFEEARDYAQAAFSRCGDGTCNEETSSCPQDCGVCGNAACEGPERTTCPQDCVTAQCGDGICDAAGGENTARCAQDCPLACGDGFCNLGGGEATSCPADCPEEACCVNTGGCPSETPYECPGACCCCAYGARCSNTGSRWTCGAG
jgi:hypothetical protein